MQQPQQQELITRLERLEADYQQKFDEITGRYEAALNRNEAAVSGPAFNRLALTTRIRRLKQARLELAEIKANYALELAQAQTAHQKALTELFIDGASRRLSMSAQRDEQSERAWLLAGQKALQLCRQRPALARAAANEALKEIRLYTGGQPKLTPLLAATA